MSPARLLFLAAFASGVSAAAQCSIHGQDFDSYPVGTTLDAVPRWTQVSASPVTVDVSPINGTPGLRMEPGVGTGPSFVRLQLPFQGQPDVLEIRMTLMTDDASVLDMQAYCNADIIQGPNTRVNLQLDGSTGIVTMRSPLVVVSTTTFTPWTPVDVRVVIDKSGDFRVEIDGNLLWEGGWNAPGVQDCARIRQLVFTNAFAPGITSSASWLDDVCVTDDVGTSYCAAQPNATGSPAVLRASGTADVSFDALTLEASSLPQNQFGIFVASRIQGFVPGAAGTSNGDLCLAGSIGRFRGPGQILGSGAEGAFSMRVPLGAIPQGSGTVSVVAGETWNFQAWFREGVGVGSNFTDGVSVTFR